MSLGGLFKREYTTRMSFKNLQFPWKTGKRYNILKGKENIYFNTPNPKQRKCVDDSKEDCRKGASNRDEVETGRLRRNTSLTRSVRDAVGNIRQRIRSSTRRRVRMKDGIQSPSVSKVSKKSTRGRSINGTPINSKKYRELKMYSPFQIETPCKTPPGIRTTHSRWQDQMETPTRLRREVDALTANMQALATLTPNTLQQRTRTRRMTKSPLTNGSLQVNHGTRTSSRLHARRSIQTSMY